MKLICCVLIVAIVLFATPIPASAAIYYDPYLGGFAYESAASYSYDSYLYGDVNSDGMFANSDLQALIEDLKSGGGSSLSLLSVSASDTSSSATTLTNSSSLAIADGSPTAAPEPSTFILAALALACLFVYRR